MNFAPPANAAPLYNLTPEEQHRLRNFPRDADGYYLDWESGDRMTPEELRRYLGHTDPHTMTASAEAAKIRLDENEKARAAMGDHD